MNKKIQNQKYRDLRFFQQRYFSLNDLQQQDVHQYHDKFEINSSLFFQKNESVDLLKNVLSKDEMATVMAKMMIAEEITYQKGLQSDSSKQLFLGHYKPILLDSLKISVEKFDSSLKYYSKNPEYFREVAELAEKQITPKDSAVAK